MINNSQKYHVTVKRQTIIDKKFEIIWVFRTIKQNIWRIFSGMQKEMDRFVWKWKTGQEITARILRAGKPDVVQGNSPQAENPAAWILPAERNGHAGNDSRKKLPYRKWFPYDSCVNRVKDISESFITAKHCQNPVNNK